MEPPGNWFPRIKKRFYFMSQKIEEKLKKLNEKEQTLYKMRHSAEHVLTQAMRNLGYKFHMAMGPATDKGFYFDFELLDGNISEEDFPKIEEEMNRIIKNDLPITKEEIDAKAAKELFENNPYKQEWISEAVEKGEKLSIYWTGKPNSKDAFVDLCAGPHVKSTGKIGAVKLLSIAGAYWRGDEKNKMLTRIYGTAFPTQQELDAFLENLEEAKRRDHKILGKKLDLFIFSDKVGGGLPMWTPKGTLLRELLDNFVWELRKAKGYAKVEIPHITKKDLYETSGHWAKFADELFKITTREGHQFVVKPMNCPHHTQIFDRKSHSYKEMPQRYANTTMVYRDEQSGELSGLSRVRSITQDDAHVFCREDQVKTEVESIWDIVESFYGAFGLPLTVRLSFHDPENMDAYLGEAKVWEETEEQIRQIAKGRDANYVEALGEAAFYGPKVDFMAKDSLGREHQVATIQIDRNMPNRFELSYINEKGEKDSVVMIHAAIMGSIERFTAVLIEHFAGAFPAWLSPDQVVVIPISEKQQDYADSILKQLRAKSIRAYVDDKNETMGNKIRKAQEQKVPYMLVVGDREKENNTVNIRLRDGQKRGETSINNFINDILEKISNKSLNL